MTTATPLIHFDANIRKMLVDMEDQANELADYLNDRGYEGRSVTSEDIVATLAQWVRATSLQHSHITSKGTNSNV